jgi:predicted transcriptional regulator
MRDELVLESTEQIRALAHPLRQRILNLLTNAPYTNKQLASLLQVTPPRLHFHVRELQAAGLIEIVSEQPKGGVIEKYYRAVARVVRLGVGIMETVDRQELIETTLEALRQEYIRANTFFEGHIPEMRFAHELVRLPADRLARIQELLQVLNSEIYQAMEDPERDTYEHFVAVTYLLHTLPSVTAEEEARP